MDIKRTKCFFVSAGFVAIASLGAAMASSAQNPTASPSPAPDTAIGNYTVSSSVEIGVRGVDVNGNHEKYKSDLNYRPGLRIFDSSFMIEDHTAGIKLFDTALVTTSGWGSDPSGSFRLNLDKSGIYKFESNVRRVRYFNNLNNHVVNWSQPFPTGSEHAMNTLHHFGDFDLTVFPERDFRLRFGYSFNDTEGPGFATLRFQSDEYSIPSNVNSNSNDIRLGVEDKLLGFNVGLNYGRRFFRDRTRFFESTFNPGNNPASSTSFLTTASRQFHTNGTTDYINGYFQRTFAHRLDVTGRLIYAESNSDVQEADALTGRASSTGDFIVSNPISVTADAKRPQTRGDIGATYRVTDKLRISDTFTFDQFTIGGGNTYSEQVFRATAAGGTGSTSNTFNSALRDTSYRRFVNTVEGDYQFNRKWAFNLGYRYTHRRVFLGKLDKNLLVVPPSISLNEVEENSNSTHSIIAGANYKPTQNWSIFADLERGESDNVFTRLANNDFFNFRVRSVATVKQFTFNLSFISKDNEDLGTTLPATAGSTIPAFDAAAKTKIRIYSGSVDWTPRSDISLSAGYTYTHQTSKTDIIVPVGTPLFPSTQFFQGVSEYYVRDSHFFFDVTARPFRRVTLYAHYWIDDDGGQGDRRITRPQDVITSYPIKFQSPEMRIAFRINRNIDWNVGYQYYSYRETPYFNPFTAVTYPTYNFFQIFQAQNYTAHLPYTSVRIYFGGSAQDRR